MSNAPEWQFDTAPEQVDLERIWNELRCGAAIYQYAYLDQLRIEAPRTYERLRRWRLGVNNGGAFKWVPPLSEISVVYGTACGQCDERQKSSSLVFAGRPHNAPETVVRECNYGHRNPHPDDE